MSKQLTIDITEGINELSNRVTLKVLFQQFGEVAACSIPPLEQRKRERAYVRFSTEAAAEAAMEACKSGSIYMDGARIGAEWRKEATKSFNNRDFDAKGSNLFSSRDFMLNARAEKEGEPSCSRSRSRSKKKSKKSKKEKKKKKKRSSSSSSSDVAPKKREGSPAVAFVREKFRAPTVTIDD